MRLVAIRNAGLIVFAFAVAASSRTAQAQEHWLLGKLRPEKHLQPTDPVAEHTQCRAGHANCIACYAHPSMCAYTGSYVGGSCAFKGCGRSPHEGTWGWDYCGPLKSEHPWLKWCHGRRCQSGTGNYKTDGPHVPDPLAKLRF